MKRIFCLIVASLGIAACDTAPTADKIPLYTCGNYEVQMSFSEDGNTMHVIIAGDTTDLTLVQSGSGAKYSGVLNDTDIVLWGKGDTWTMFVGPDETMLECSVK